MYPRCLMRFMVLLLLTCGGLFAALAGTPVTINFTAPNDEEFVGPFASWKNVKTDYGAVGDGITDDTAAIQKALDDLRLCRNNGWSTLYFPAGIYKITSTLTTLRQGGNDYQGDDIVGEDPATTIIRWGGVKAAEMFKWDSWYCKICRLTFDGNNVATIGLWKVGNFSTACEESDLWFKNVGCGIYFDGSKAGQAEQLVIRCRFDKCSNGGVVLLGWNTLDIWVWDCLFTDCHDGIRCVTGGFHAYNNVFLRSTEGDIGDGCGGFFSIVGNTSIDSNLFIAGTIGGMDIGGGFVGNLFMKDNKIYDPVIANPVAIGASPFTMMDNLIASPAAAVSPVIKAANLSFLALNNTYTVPSWPISPIDDVTGGRLPATNGFDGDIKTYALDPWRPSNKNVIAWLQYNFAYGFGPAAQRQTVVDYAITSANDRKVDPKDWTLSGSNDNANWTVIDTQVGQVFTADRQRVVYKTNNATPYCMYRLSITKNSADNVTPGWKLAELELLDNADKSLIVPGGFAMKGEGGEWNQHLVLDDKCVAKGTQATPTTLTLPDVPKNMKRQIFEVAPGATAAQIQAAIDAAVKAGNRAVVHIPAYSLKGAPAPYNIGVSLVVPPNADIQLVGDGGKQWGSTLAWVGGKNATGPLLRLDGPTHVIIKDIELKGLGGNNATVVQVTNGDQDKGEVFVQNCSIGGGNNPIAAESSYFMNGVDDTIFTAIGSSSYGYCKYGVKAVGGPKLAAGKPANGRFATISGAAGNCAATISVVDVQKGGRVAHQGFYIEQSDAPIQQLKLSKTNGQVSFTSTRFSINTDAATPTFLLDSHVGEMTMIGCHHVNIAGPGHWFQLTGDGSKMQALVLGPFCSANNDLWPDKTKIWQDTTAPQADAALIQSPQGNFYKQTFGSLPNEQFVRDRVAFARTITAPLPQPGLGPDITAVRIYGSMITPGKDQHGIEVDGAAAPAQQCATPTFNPAAGNFAVAQQVAIASTTPNATIYYTLDGSDPTAQTGTKYVGPVNIDKTLKLKAIATADKMQDSAIAAGDYTIGGGPGPAQQCATPTFNPAAGNYEGAQQVTITTATPNATIYYTLDGSDPTAQAGTKYVGPVNIDKTLKLKAIATADKMQDSLIASGDYTITAPGPETYQPDLAIHPVDQDTLFGENVYNDAASGTATQATSRNAPAVYEIVARNDATAADMLKLTGPASTVDWTIAYFDDVVGGNDITAAVTGAGWFTPKLDPQGRALLRVEVTPATTVPWNTAFPVTLSAVSKANGGKGDFVIANTLCANLPLTAVRLVANPAGTVVVKRPVTLTATPVGGRNVQYCFYVKDATGWTLIQKYSANRVCTWTPTKDGTFALLVWAREITSNGMWDVNATIWNYTVKPTISAVALAANPAITVQAGAAVLLTATPTGGDIPEYAFFLKGATGCTTLQPYGAANTYTWVPKDPGTYTVLVWVREKGSTQDYQTNASVVNFVVTK